MERIFNQDEKQKIPQGMTVKVSNITAAAPRARTGGPVPQFDDLPRLPAAGPKREPVNTSLGFRAGSAYREGEKQFRSAVLDPALAAVKGITRPFVEPIISNGPQVVSNAAGGIADFGRGVVGAEPRSSLVAPSVAAPRAAPTALSVIPDAQAKPATTQQGGARPTKPTTPGFAARHFSANQPGGAPANDLFTTLDGGAASAALDATDPRTAVIQGRFAGGVAPETRSYTQAGVADAGKRLNVVPGLFSGVSRETEQALAEARQAASERGDFEAVERSYLNPEQRADYDAAKAERQILKRLPNLPAPELNDALKGLTDLRTARTGQLPSLDQVKAGRATELLSGNPGELTAADQALFGNRPPETQRRIVSQPTGEVDAAGLPTGAKRFYSVDPATGESVAVDLAGGTGSGAANGNLQSRASIREAFRAGQITREQARALNDRLAAQP